MLFSSQPFPCFAQPHPCSAQPSVLTLRGFHFQARRKEKQATADMKRRYQQGGAQFTDHANVAMHTTLVRTHASDLERHV